MLTCWVIAEEADVNVTHIFTDFLDLDIAKVYKDFDIVYLEVGILPSCFIISKLVEGPRIDSHKNIPGEFKLVTYK